MRQNFVHLKKPEYSRMFMCRTIYLFSFICIALLATKTNAADFQSHASIHDAARVFILDHIQSSYDQTPVIQSGKLDTRLKLRQCSQALETALPDGSRGIGKITLAVKCTDDKPWSLHVPMKVSLFKEVLVAKEPLPRGKLLEKNDLKRAKYDLAKLPHGYINSFKNSVGMKLKRPIAAGVAITPKMVEKPKVILRGQRVTILAKGGGIMVRTSGKALANGAVGDRIGVINIKSKQKMEGIVTGSGEVNVAI